MKNSLSVLKKVENIVVMIGFIVLSQQLYGQEICDNAIDDDGDGLVDLNDTTDCTCEGIVYNSSGIIQSLITNSSFEEYENCPSGYSQMLYVEGWDQATDATSDYYNSNSECNFSGSTSSAIPYPHGNAIVGVLIANKYFGPGGNWQEYIGTCLSAPLSPGTEYAISFFIASKVIDAEWCDSTLFYGDIDFTVFGNDDCDFPVPTLECPTGFASWAAIGSTNYTPQKNWLPITISFTPTIPTWSIMIGGPCVLPMSYTIEYLECVPYFMLDGLILAEASTINVYIKAMIDVCSQNRMLHATANSAGGTWQWYYNGIALVGATSGSLDLEIYNRGIGNYTAIYSLPSSSSCYGTTYYVGQQGLLPKIPNVITPNHDGVNDFIDFSNYLNGCDYQVDIFNRWGQLVFTQTTISPPFKGLTFNSNELTEGLYYYVLSINDYQKSGTITLIR